MSELQKGRIAKQIHDDLAQQLTLLGLELYLIEQQLDATNEVLSPTAFREKIKALTELVAGIIQATQKIAVDLRPKVLDEFGLIAALESESEQFQRRTGMRLELAAPSGDVVVDADVATEIFRLTQEMLSNAARHSKGSRVEIRIEEQPNWLMLQVRDNGRGITEGEIADARSLGLSGMRERARNLNGEFEVAGTAGEGTTVTVRVPRTARVKSQPPT
jgi:signal transduction histidine kinase